MGATGNLITLMLFLGFVGGFAWIGYQMYVYSTELADRGQNYMKKKNINVGASGMKVGVRHMDQEEYSSRTQNAIVNAWNLSSWPAYKSMFWNQNADINKRAACLICGLPSSPASPAPASSAAAKSPSSKSSRPSTKRSSSSATKSK